MTTITRRAGLASCVLLAVSVIFGGFHDALAQEDDDFLSDLFDLTFAEYPVTGSFSVSLEFLEAPDEPPGIVILHWDGGRREIELDRDTDGTSFTTQIIRLRPAGPAQELGEIDDNEPGRRTFLLPPETRSVRIEYEEESWPYDIDLSRFVQDPKIRDVFVVENQQLFPYPFHRDGSELEHVQAKTHAGATTRRLIVHGENLKEAARAGEALKSSSKAISYAFDSTDLEEGERWLSELRKALDRELTRAKSAKDPIPRLVEKLQRRSAALRDVKNLVVVHASLHPGVTPGSQQMMLRKSRGSWPLLFGNQEAALQFVRHDDFVRADSLPIFYPGDIGAVDLVFKTDIPFNSIEVQLLHRPVFAKEGENATEVGKIRARRLDDLGDKEKPIFRTDPIHIVSNFNPLRRPPDSDDAFYLTVFKGDKIGARLVDPARAITMPPVAIAEIYNDPGELGELWKSALGRVAKCDGDTFNGDPIYALKKSTRVSRLVIGEIAKYGFPAAAAAAKLLGNANTPIDFNPSVQLHKGDHAAALLIRDELIGMMVRLQPGFVPLTNNRNGEAAAVRKWAVSSGQVTSLPMLKRYDVKLEVRRVPGNPGKAVDWINEALLVEYVETGEARSISEPILYEKSLSEFIDQRTEIAERHSIPLQSYDSWLDSRIQAAAKKWYDALSFAIGAADKAKDCNLEELLVVVGQKAKPATARIVPRLVKKISRRGPPYAEHWGPDKVARGFVERLHLGGEAVAALDQYAALDDTYKALAVALTTAGVAFGASGFAGAIGLSSAASGTIGASVLIAGDIADAAYFGANDLERGIGSERFYQYAQGVSLVIGDDILTEAEAQRQSMGMALIGLIAPGIGAGMGVRDLRYFRNINKGRALIKTEGAGVLDDLDSLTELERTQVAAYLDDTLTKTQTVGLDSLDEIDRAAMDSLYRRTFARKEPLESAAAEPKSAPEAPDNSKAASGIADPSFRNAPTQPITRSDVSPDGSSLIRDMIRPPRDYKILPGQRETAVNSPFAREVTDVPDTHMPVGSIDGSQVVDSNGNVIGEIGEELGRGSFSIVHIDPDNPEELIKRVTPLDTNAKYPAKTVEKVVLDDAVGRQLLEEAQSPGGYFRISKRDGDPILVTDKNDPSKRYLVSTEENIANDIRKDGKRITCASDRFHPKKGRPPTKAERVTMNLAIRELNQKGILWMDHKLGNFDIVADSASPTGHRMVIFDPGGFKTMKGKNPEMMWRNARQWQQIIDGSPPDLGALAMRLQKGGYYDVEDLRPFGGMEFWPSTPGANMNRTEYLRLNNLDPAEFRTQVEALSQQLGKEIPYAPPGG